MEDLISPWVYGSRYLSGRRAANLQPPPSWKNFCSPRPQLDPWGMPRAWLDEESPRQRGSMGFLLRVGYMWILDYAERETAFENQFVQRNETNVTTNDNTVLAVRVHFWEYISRGFAWLPPKELNSNIDGNDCLPRFLISFYKPRLD